MRPLCTPLLVSQTTDIHAHRSTASSVEGMIERGMYAPAWPAVQIQTGGVQLSETLACTTCPPALSPLLLLSISSNRYQENSLAVCRVA